MQQARLPVPQALPFQRFILHYFNFLTISIKLGQRVEEWQIPIQALRVTLLVLNYQYGFQGKQHLLSGEQAFTQRRTVVFLGEIKAFLSQIWVTCHFKGSWKWERGRAGSVRIFLFLSSPPKESEGCFKWPV